MTKLSDTRGATTDILKFGNEYQMVAVLYAGQGQTFLAVLPGDEDNPRHDLLDDVDVLDLDLADWQRLLRQTDLLETEILQRAGDGTILKAIMRKSQRQIEQGISWAVYHRDGYACRYCGKGSGIPLTVDHLVCWEVGGPSTVENLVAACRKCNKTRGQTPYADWLRHPYYLKVSQQGLTRAQLLANEALAATLSSIPLVTHVRSHR